MCTTWVYLSTFPRVLSTSPRSVFTTCIASQTQYQFNSMSGQKESITPTPSKAPYQHIYGCGSMGLNPVTPPKRIFGLTNTSKRIWPIGGEPPSGGGCKEPTGLEASLVSPRDSAKWPDQMEIPAMAPSINQGLPEPMTSQCYSIIHGDLRKTKSVAQNIKDT